MSHDLIIHGGRIIAENGACRADIAVRNGRIAAIGHDLGEAEAYIDAGGLIVSPGMVDAHVHISEPGGGYRDDWEGYETGTRACAKGGVTTIVEMPLNQVPATVDKQTLDIKLAAGQGKLSADVASYGGLVPFALDHGIEELDAGGVVGYKCFLATCGDRAIEGDFMNVDDYSLYEGMKRIARTGKVLTVHSENAAITDKLGEMAYQAGKKDFKSYEASRPVVTELEAIRKIILFARDTGCRVHIVHVACWQGVAEVTRARREGVDITCETCTHYLYFDLDELDAIGPVAKCSPPIRDKANQDRMWDQLLAREIDYVTSDHSPCTPDIKDTDNVFDAWGGIAGVQSNIDVLFDEGVNKRGMSLATFADIIARRPAERFDLTNKGAIAVGKDADLTFIDPDASHTLKAEELAYRNQISPYVGRTFGARVIRTILRGETVYDVNSGVVGDPKGQFVFSE